MSPARALPPLNEQQVEAVLSEALSRSLYETDVEGKMPEDPGQRLADAQRLIVMAQQAYEAGSRNEDVAAFLFIAEVDMQPQAATESEGGPVEAGGMTTLDDSTLIRMEKALSRAAEVAEDGDEDMAPELTAVRAEIERRGIGQQPSTNGSTVAPADDSSERASLENRLTFPIMRAHNIDPSEIATLSMETLRWIVDHPEGGKRPEAPSESEQAFAPASETLETTQVHTQPPPAELTQEPEAQPESGISASRESLEEQVTGPMLKAYGRGRSNVPDIGDHELAFMIEHPDGRVTAEQLEAAKALDRGDAPALAEEPAAPVAEPVVASQPVEEAAPPPAPAPVAPPPTLPAVAAPAPDTTAAELHVPEEATRDAREHFEQTIAREHLPIPAEITEEPPVMPFDMSKSSRDEIYSLHAKFHACESRINFLITNQEDSLGDLEKLRHARELDVEASIPVTVDGKKLTEAQRASRVASDPQVQTYKTAEHNIGKELRKMKVLRDNYHKDVERCSRQMTRWIREAEGA